MRTDRFKEYIETWKGRGYGADIPDEVPDELLSAGVAPSYKAVALAILKNDWHATTLGFSAPKSPWYGAFKSIEIRQRTLKEEAAAARRSKRAKR